MTVSGTWWHLLSSNVFLVNAVFIAQYCAHKWIKIVFYWIAGGVYWSAVSFTNPPVTITGPQCRLQIRDVIFKSGCQLLIRGKKIKCSKQTQNRSNFFARSPWFNDLIFMNFFSPLHNPFKDPGRGLFEEHCDPRLL